MKNFASDILVMVPILYSFLTRVVAPLGHMADNITCFGLLFQNPIDSAMHVRLDGREVC